MSLSGMGKDGVLMAVIHLHQELELELELKVYIAQSHTVLKVYRLRFT